MIHLELRGPPLIATSRSFRSLSFLAPLAALSIAGCASDARRPSPEEAPADPSPPIAAAPICAPRSPRRLERAAVVGASSAVDLVRAGDRRVALIADGDERALHAVDVETMREIGVTPLPGRPGHVLALENGLVAVALRDTATVVILEPGDEELQKPFEERCSARVASEPWAVAEAGGDLLVTSGFGAALTVLRGSDLLPLRALPLPREPRAVILDAAGATAFVTHAVGGVVSAIDLKDGGMAPEAIHLQAGRRINAHGGADDEHPREASQGYALASIVGPGVDGERETLRIFAPHTSVDPGAPDHGASVGYGGAVDIRPVTELVSVIDPRRRRSITNHVAGAFRDRFAPECLLPRGAVADEGALFVACLDLDAVIELDPSVGDPSVAERRRFALPAGPSALSLDASGKQIFAFSEIDRALSRIDRDSGDVASVALWRRSGQERDARLDRGRRLFVTSRDARISVGRACASCHPEGRDDGLVWSSPDGARQTPMLAGRLSGTAPYGWFGENATVRDHVRKTFARLGGTGFNAPAQQADLDALLAYAASIPLPEASPPPDPAAAERGRVAFASNGCDGCHRDGSTDGLAHDVGSGVKGERHGAFDTPSLAGVRASAPYFHDGRYRTLGELLGARDAKMIPDPLSGPDARDLEAYLETL
jgi:hypothetical protein